MKKQSSVREVLTKLTDFAHNYDYEPNDIKEGINEALSALQTLIKEARPRDKPNWCEEYMAYNQALKEYDDVLDNLFEER